MRKKAPDGLTASERAMYARLKKGPAALSSLAHAARCYSGSVKAILSRLRRKLPAGESIPRGYYGYQTYHLEISKSAALSSSATDEKTETETTPVNADEKERPATLQNERRNNILCVAKVQPYYTLCELTLRQYRYYRDLARATILLVSHISRATLPHQQLRRGRA